MQDDIPIPIYSFEHAAIRDGRLKTLLRALDGMYCEGDTLNFGGHRFRVIDESMRAVTEFTDEDATAAGFQAGEGLSPRDKLLRWADRSLELFSDKHLKQYRLEPLERYSDDPKGQR